MATEAVEVTGRPPRWKRTIGSNPSAGWRATACRSAAQRMTAARASTREPNDSGGCQRPVACTLIAATGVAAGHALLVTRSPAHFADIPHLAAEGAFRTLQGRLRPFPPKAVLGPTFTSGWMLRAPLCQARLRASCRCNEQDARKRS